MLSVTRIPYLMKGLGKSRGARLMETWFARPAATAPRYSETVADVITMDWVLAYGRAKQVFDKLLKDKIWTNKAAQKEIGKMLHRKGFLGNFSGSQVFGELDLPVPKQDADYVNQRVLSYDIPPVDDLTAALGAFSMRVVVAGTVAPRREGGWSEYVKGHLVTIEEIGVYVRDSYDFEGDQFLGFFADAGTYYTGSDGYRRYLPNGAISNLPFDGSDLVNNYDFRNYRKKFGRGGDFLVFSDLKRISSGVGFDFNTEWLLNEEIIPSPPLI